MAAMAATYLFCNGAISENVQGPKKWHYTKYYTSMKKRTFFFFFPPHIAPY